MVEITESGVIYQNPLPSVQPLQAQFPGLCRISNRELLCIYKRGPAPAAVACESAVVRSHDAGQTWHQEGALWNRDNDAKPYSYGYGFPTRLDSGEILCTGYRWDRSNSDPDWNIYNPRTQGAVPLEALLFRSTDDGHTWSAPEVIPPPEDVAMANPSGRIVPLSDGRLLLPLETWKAWDDECPIKQRSLVALSSDGGQTWRQHVTVAMDPEHRLLYWNGMFSPLDDGRILVMYWMKDSHTEEDLNIHATWSDDEGQSWRAPYDTGIVGQMGCTIDVGAGRVLAIYNRRDRQKPGVWAVVSSDGGRTWPRDNRTLLWDARGRDTIGSADPDNRSRSIYDEGLMAFGKPDAIRLDKDSFLAGYWCTSNFVMHLRYARLVVT